MPNMSYCRFENTAADLLDCLNAMQEAIDDGYTLKEFRERLSSENERNAFDRFLIFATDVAELAEE